MRAPALTHLWCYWSRVASFGSLRKCSCSCNSGVRLQAVNHDYALAHKKSCKKGLKLIIVKILIRALLWRSRPSFNSSNLAVSIECFVIAPEFNKSSTRAFTSWFTATPFQVEVQFGLTDQQTKGPPGEARLWSRHDRTVAWLVKLTVMFIAAADYDADVAALLAGATIRDAIYLNEI